jgi:excisionase family DNA binding protein
VRTSNKPNVGTAYSRGSDMAADSSETHGTQALPPIGGSQRAFSILEFCRIYGVGRTTAYQQVKAGRLRVVKVGKRTLVPVDAAETWLKNLPSSEAVS